MAVIFGTIHAAGLQGGCNFYTRVRYSWEGVFLSSSLIQLWGEVCKMTEECTSSATRGVEQWIGSIHTPEGALHCEALRDELLFLYCSHLSYYTFC